MSDSAYRAAALLVDAFARLGLRHACVTPGSRNTPLSLALAEHPLVTDWIHHDERSSSFFALGLAKASRTPVAVVTTSGTAAAELLPAAVEARYAGVPLLLLTADRPPELRGIGTPQTIDQVGLFGSAVRTSSDVMLVDMDSRGIESLAESTWGASNRRPRRPVHLNLGFREPFVPMDLSMPSSSVKPRAATSSSREAPEALASMLSGKRTLVIAGPFDDPGFVGEVTKLADRADWPIAADPQSQLRAGRHDLSRIVTSGDVLFSANRLPGQPEAVIRFGGPLTSKAINSWLATHPHVPQVIVDEEAGRDPTGTASLAFTADPVATAASLSVDRAPEDWARSWMDAERRARAALEGSPFPSEPGVVEAMARAASDESILYVASSMPIRNVDRFFPTVDRRLRILANRGANGIDGLVSSGLGAAATGQRTYVLTGDLSLLHDVGALATAARRRLPVTIIVVNNDGGGIFSFLPQSRLPRHFERVFATPHGLSFVPIARSFGLQAMRAESIDEFERAVDRPGLVEVVTNRQDEVDVQKAAIERVTSS